MFKINDYIVYQKDVCKIVDTKKSDSDIDSYILIPQSDQSLKIEIAKSSPKIRSLIDQDSIEKLIKEIPKVEPLVFEEKLLEKEYRVLLENDNHEDLIKLIKTSYFRIEERQEIKKTIGEKEKTLLNLAEKYLFNEFSIVMGISIDKVKSNFIESIKS